MTGPARQREGDPDADDWTYRRRPVQGDEVNVGIGKYHVTLRGGIVIIVVVGIAMLALVAYHIREQDRAYHDMKIEHRQLAETIAKAIRIQACVSSMTMEEKVAWRKGAISPEATFLAFCPGLVAGGIPIP